MAENPAVPLDIRFKGSRTYLHGTDLFDALIALSTDSPVASIESIRLSFYRPITQRVEALRIQPGSVAGFRPAALMELRVDGVPWVWALRERMGEAVEGRRPYDEAQVSANAVVEGSSIAQPRPTPYTFIERTVALNKRLLDGMRRDPGVSWWFGRLELGRLPSPAPALRLSANTEPGGRLVRSSIEADGVQAGSIYFSEKKSA